MEYAGGVIFDISYSSAFIETGGFKGFGIVWEIFDSNKTVDKDLYLT